MEALLDAAGIRMTHVPYPGGAPAAQALVSGQVDVALLVGILSMPYIKSGQLRPLAVGRPTRARTLPDVPTFSEEGFAELSGGDWMALLAPKGTPPEVVALLNRDVRKLIDGAVSRSEFGPFYVEDFQVPEGSSPAAMDQVIRDEVVKWRDLTRRIQFKPE